MIRKYLTLFIFIISSHAFCQDNLKLWYKKPAKVWTEALPVGNGRLGAMVFGGVKQELIQLNEATLWSGGPVRTNVNPNAYANLLLAREALFKDSDYAKANEYAKKMQGYYSDSYLPLGDVSINQELPDKTPSSYYRDLNIKDAISTTTYTINGVTYTRQVISSAADQVIVIHLTASKPKGLNFTIAASSQLKYWKVVISNNEIALKGKAPAHDDPNYVNSKNPVVAADTTGCKGTDAFELQVKALTKDGLVTADTSGISIKNATEATIYLSAATSFNGFDKCPVSDGKDESKLAAGYLNGALQKNWPALLARHEADYHKYFNRLSFSLQAPSDNKNASLPTDERLVAYTNGATDPGLETLYFQYGRYLLISSSRTKAVPANLQGIWNKELQPPWSSNYTTNINVEMNYWPAEEANLSEMHQPLIDFIKNEAVTGKITAMQFYHARGWAVHHNSDIWALSNPVGDLGQGDPMWANWTMGSPWLSEHLWGHYQFTKDKKYLLETAYPLMKGAGLFCLDWLVPYKGYLVTAPSVSPENSFKDENGKRGSVSIATTMDMEIIRDLFTNIINASNELGIDKLFRDSIIAAKAKLYPFHIGKKGNLQEWYKDFDETEPHHRHVSHLFGLYPSNQISPITTPELATAAMKTLELRGDDGTGWSLAWKINFWARLLDGNHSYKLLKYLLRATDQPGTNYKGGGGSYINLFDAHPPFQIDGNFGGLAGMTEMLLQSQNDEIALLPALPDAWATGKISGLKARGNFEVAINWKNGKLTNASVFSLVGGKCIIRTNHPVKISGLQVSSKKTANGYLTNFVSKKGVKYKIISI